MSDRRIRFLDGRFFMIKISGALTGIRIFLILYIVNGHFCQLGTQNPWALKFFKQHNLVVGCFFILSGYILALVYGQRSQDTEWNTLDFFKKRLCRIYPLYLFLTLLFAPMYIWVEHFYGQSPLSILWHSTLVLTMTQAFIPELGTLWNSPTWFLSSLVFAYLVFPVTFRWIRNRNPRGLWCLSAVVFLVLLGSRVIYSELTSWSYMEGMLREDQLPWFNEFRFFPLFNFPEFFLGMTAGLLYLRSPGLRDWPAYADLSLVAGLLGLLVVRLWVPGNDLMARTLVMTPLFLILLWTLTGGWGIVGRFLSQKWVVLLGDWSFAVYLLHGPLGQLLYKKAVRAIHNGPDVPYPVYLLSLLFFSAILYRWVEMPASRWLSRRRAAG